MSFLPDIEDGQLKPTAPSRKLYTPPKHAGSVMHVPTLQDIKREGPKRRDVDAPRMSDIHECEPDYTGRCHYCQREMSV